MNKYLIDTSSLMILARYYHPLDKDSRLKDIVHDNFEQGRWLLHNKVKTEAERIAQGIILSRYPFLDGIELLPTITEILPKQQEKIDNNWVAGSAKNKLGIEEYSKEKQRQITGADFQLILTALTTMKNKGLYEKPYIIVTEETETPNDNKLFKKIPMICKHEKIRYTALPKLFDECGIGVQFLLK